MWAGRAWGGGRAHDGGSLGPAAAAAASHVTRLKALSVCARVPLVLPTSRLFSVLAAGLSVGLNYDAVCLKDRWARGKSLMAPLGTEVRALGGLSGLSAGLSRGMFAFPREGLLSADLFDWGWRWGENTGTL